MVILLVAVVGMVLGVALLALGVWSGRMLSRPPRGQVIVGWREFWRFGPSPKYRLNRRAVYLVWATIAVGFALGRANTPVIAPLMPVSVGISYGAVLNTHVRA